MDKRIKKHILFDIIIMSIQLVFWGCMCLVHPIIALVVGIPIVALFFAFLLRTIRWCRIALDVRHKNPEVIHTKGYRFATREQINDFFNLRYSKVFFDDENLKKDFIYFENEVFSHGDLLEIVYYEKSRFIKSIKKIS